MLEEREKRGITDLNEVTKHNTSMNTHRKAPNKEINLGENEFQVEEDRICQLSLKNTIQETRKELEM